MFDDPPADLEVSDDLAGRDLLLADEVTGESGRRD
jgi:hypothetical protein